METKKLTIGMIAVLAVAFIVAISGCIGGGNGGGEGPAAPSNNGSQQVSGDDNVSGEGGHEISGEEKKQIKNEPSENEQEEGLSFADILPKLSKPTEYSVAYDFEANAEGAVEKGKRNMYMSGERMRIDMDMKEMSFRTYVLPPAFYMCTNQQGSWNCMSVESTEDTDVKKYEGEFETSKNEVVYDGTQIIAGVTAQCYKLATAGTTARMCIHPEAYVLLLVESENFKMTATSVDLSKPDESVFVLPAKATDIREMMKGMGTDPCETCNMITDSDAKNACLENC